MVRKRQDDPYGLPSEDGWSLYQADEGAYDDLDDLFADLELRDRVSRVDRWFEENIRRSEEARRREPRRESRRHGERGHD